MSKRTFLTGLLENASKEKAFTEEEVKQRITIMPSLQGLIPPLLGDELRQLEENILMEGCREPLILWKNEQDYVLIDGHNRYGICEKHKINFKIVIKEFKDYGEVKTWMINNQLGRRNLAPEQQSYLRGMRYEQEKTAHGGDRKSGEIKGKDLPLEKIKGKNLPLENTAQKLASEYHVSDKTIKNDALFAKGIELIGNSNPQLKQAILSGNAKVSKSDLQAIGKLDKSQIPAIQTEADISAIIQNVKRKSKPVSKTSLSDDMQVEQMREALLDAGSEVIVEIKGSFLLRKGLAVYWQELRQLEKPITADFTDYITWGQAKTIGLVK